MNIIQINNRLPYNIKHGERTKDLRKNMTKSEKSIWYGFLREFSNSKYRVYKQRPIDNFIVDFYIPKLKLVIEIDGDTHFDDQGIAYDIERTNILEGLGLNVIRYINLEVLYNIDGVYDNFISVVKSLEY